MGKDFLIFHVDPKIPFGGCTSYWGGSLLRVCVLMWLRLESRPKRSKWAGMYQTWFSDHKYDINKGCLDRCPLSSWVHPPLFLVCWDFFVWIGIDIFFFFPPPPNLAYGIPMPGIRSEPQLRLMQQCGSSTHRTWLGIRLVSQGSRDTANPVVPQRELWMLKFCQSIFLQQLISSYNFLLCF